MTDRETMAALQRAAEISRELVAIADGGDVRSTQRLDAERLELLRVARRPSRTLGDDARGLLREIADLNARAIGLMEHRLRCTVRDMDMLRAGRRAVRAYAANGRHDRV